MLILLCKGSNFICIFLEPEVSLQKRKFIFNSMNLFHINHSKAKQGSIGEYMSLDWRLYYLSLKRFKNQHPGEETA